MFDDYNYDDATPHDSVRPLQCARASKKAGGKPLARRLRTVIASMSIAIVIMLCSCLINTILCRSRQIRVVPVPTVKPLAGFEMRLCRAIQFRTVSGERDGKQNATAFHELHDYLRKSFPKTHARLDREVHAGLSLLYHWKGSDPAEPPILLMSHLDVVPVEAGTAQAWTHPPFAGQLADGSIWGRGALDMKCGALGLFEAVELLLAKDFEPKGDIYLAFGHDEETGGREGNRRIADALRERGVRFRFVLDEGGGILEGMLDGIGRPVAYIGIAEKGYASVRLHATASGGHSSMPPRTSAIGALARAIQRLEADPFLSRIDGASEHMLDYLAPELPWPRRAVVANRWLTASLIRRQFGQKPALDSLVRTTLAVTMVHGGVAQNVLPKHAEATVNLRLLPGETSATALARVRRIVADPAISCSLLEPIAEPSPLSSTISSGFRVLQRSIAEIFPGLLVVPGLTVAASDSRHYASIATDIYRFLPIRLKPDDLSRIHGVDERIAVKNYAELIAFLARLIINSAAADATSEGPLSAASASRL